MNSIEESFDIEPDENVVVRVQIEPATRKSNTEEPTKQDFVDDYNFARDTLNTVIKTGVEALNGVMNSAAESGHPRAYEVVATLLNQLSGASKDLLSLSEVATKIAPVESEKKDKSEDYFVGSTKELNAMIEDGKDGK